MQSITTATELKDAIQLLEVEQAVKGLLLKEQFYLTYEGLKPINILRSTFNDIVSSPNIIDNLLGTTVGIATGYLSKKVFVAGSGNIIRNFFGSLLKQGVTNVVAQHPDIIKSLGQSIFQYIFRKKENVAS
jgi:hypothetical protein